MENNSVLVKLKESLIKAKNILILTGANPSLDSVASSLALYLIFKKQAKNVHVSCPTPMTVAFNRLIGVNKIRNKIGNRNLTISFNYVKDSIEKVSYNIENNKFNLVIEPKNGQPPLNSDKVSYNYSGVSADIIFIIGAAKLEDLGNFYLTEKQTFFNSLTVNIDNKKNNTNFGKINLCDSSKTSCSELIIALIQGLNLTIDQDIATNLYAGIKANTANFQAINVNAETFEFSAWCLKNGARKNQMANNLNSFVKKQAPPLRKNINLGQQSSPSLPFVQPTNSLNQPETLIENKEAKAPPDWLKPKIYRGNTKI